jgi:hypothetical protein
MDEGEKPFPIEYIVILLIIAIANDVAEIFFDLLDFTGVGIAGEAIMEPANFVLDLFFTGIFWWKVGPGGGTITQYIGDLLEPFLIPGRTLSVLAGMYLANHPNSALGKVANTAASLESGGATGAIGETEGVAGKLEGEAASAEKKLQGEGAGTNEGESKAAGKGSTGESESPEGKAGAGENESTPESDVFKNPYENPVGTAAEEEFNPSEDAIQEGKGFNSGEKSQEDEVQPQSGIHIASRRPPAPPKQDHAENIGDEELDEAA